MTNAEELVVITKTHDLILWSCNRTSQFPRNHRFVLGERIERNLLGLRTRTPRLARLIESEELNGDGFRLLCSLLSLFRFVPGHLLSEVPLGGVAHRKDVDLVGADQEQHAIHAGPLADPPNLPVSSYRWNLPRRNVCW
jgi:hypothetical protein